MSDPAVGTGPDPVLAIAGPTAVGKSEVALFLAEALNGEIVSVDSMQVYRGMDIGTAKPSPADRARVEHHLIDVVDVGSTFDAAQFVMRAGEALEKIRRRGRLPILCGGTGLYFRALFDGLGQAPPASPGLRAELESTPLPELLRELAQSDPITFERIDQHNPRRVIRALEVVRLTGKSYSLQRADWSSSRVATPNPMFGLRRSSEDLRERIDKRVEAMFARGLVAEINELLQRGLTANRTAAQALGYRQVVDFLSGVRPLDQTMELVKVRTWQFAKRQMAWFRRQSSLCWIDVGPNDSPEQIAREIVRRRTDLTPCVG